MTLYDGGHSEYNSGKLDIEDLKVDPFEMLQDWLDAAKAAKVTEPTAMTLATATLEATPSARVVLLRGLDTGLVFYTNYQSRKGTELTENPKAAACLWWAALERQVRVEGEVVPVSAEESDAYFASRPKDSRAASAASPQSQIIPNRESIEKLMQEYLELDTIARPEHWGGYRLIPSYFEFWQGRKARLHDRFCYVRAGDEWLIHRLAP